MIYRRLYHLFIFALWFAMVVLAIFTAIASLASLGRSDCALLTAPSNTSYSTITVDGGINCTFNDHLAEYVRRHPICSPRI